jgi:copper chaperone CopZ
MRTLIFLFFFLLMFSCGNNQNKKQEQQSKIDVNTLTVAQLHISGMTCTGCETTIKKAVREIEGVSEVTASFIDSIAVVKFDSSIVSATMINEHVNELGYTVTEVTYLPTDNN